MIDKILKIEKSIKIKFKNKKILIQALTHKSANLDNNNEKLEFLGDRVIGLVLSKKLLDLYPAETVGSLDKRFAKLVNRKTCCDIAWSIGIQNHIIIGNSKKKITKRDEKILSDCCEALIGAIYIDHGFSVVKEFILTSWKKNIKMSNVTTLDPKTELQEYSLKIYKKLPTYKLVNSTGPRHNPLYKISVSVIGSKDFVGTGRSKRIAEQEAAKKLLKNIEIN
tara:strand:+ start:1041 stop:1709 length:669 start_codon:yes stop_codon:yes gene_type:complete